MKTALKVAALTLTMAAAVPAHAVVIIDFNNVATAENVLFASSTSVASPTLVAATNSSNTPVTFANTLGLIADASGQSSTTNASGFLAGTTSVTIASGSIFTAAEFNVPGIPGTPPPAEAATAFIEALGLGGAVIGSNTLNISGNGENRIRVIGTAGETFTGFRVTLAPTGSGVDALTQVRLGGVSRVTAPVPEPATWLLMLLGFGGIGFAMRKRSGNVQTRVRFAL